MAIARKHRKPEDELTVPYQTRIRDRMVQQIKTLQREYRTMDGKQLSEAAVLRKLLRLGMLRYREHGQLPENED